jgi:hypothetical protein
MAARWYCLVGQQQYGPFTSEQIQQLVQQGQLQPKHFLRTETDSQWTPAADLPGLFPASAAAAAPPPAASAPTERTKKSAVRAVSDSAPAAATPQPPQVPPASPASPASPAAVPRAAGPTAIPAAPIPVAAPLPVAGASGPAAPIPVARAAVPVASAAPALSAGISAGVPVGSGPAPVAGRPIPVQPHFPAASTAGRALGGKETLAQRRRRKKNSRLVVGGLSAALLLLIVVAVVVLNRTPSPQVAERGRNAASQESGGDPEIDVPTVLDSGGAADEIADPLPATVAATVEPDDQPDAQPKSTGVLPISKWLAADRQKGGLVKVVRLGVDRAWRESVGGQQEVLNIEVKITNLSPDRPLDFSGWRVDVQPQAKLQAVLFDDQGNQLAAQPPRSAARRPAAGRSIAAGQTETERLSFRLPSREFEQLHLALPYAALGQPGYLGFELSAEMIQAAPSGRPQGVQQEPPDNPLETEPPAADPLAAEAKPEVIPDVRELIEGQGRATAPAEEFGED